MEEQQYEEPPIYELIEYEYTTEELKTLGQKLAVENQKIYDLHSRKKAYDAAVMADIKAADEHAATLTTQINTGREQRNTQVIYCMDSPDRGIKTILRKDTGDTIRTEPMTPAEKQQELFPGIGRRGR